MVPMKGLPVHELARSCFTILTDSIELDELLILKGILEREQETRRRQSAYRDPSTARTLCERDVFPCAVETSLLVVLELRLVSVRDRFRWHVGGRATRGEQGQSTRIKLALRVSALIPPQERENTKDAAMEETARIPTI